MKHVIIGIVGTTSTRLAAYWKYAKGSYARPTTQVGPMDALSRSVQKGPDARHDEHATGSVLEVRRRSARRSNNADGPLWTLLRLEFLFPYHLHLLPLRPTNINTFVHFFQLNLKFLILNCYAREDLSGFFLF